jgi:chromosome-anchoring protein RacA
LGGKDEMMNTSEVAKLLGVSASTVQRWVKQLELPMERNDRGHYLFNQVDIELLKKIQLQIQNGTLLQDITPPQEKKNRIGAVKSVENNQAIDNLFTKVKELEIDLSKKADSVVSYQLLQHRREIDELQNQIKELAQQLTTVQNQLNEIIKPQQLEKPLVFDQGKAKRKKKNIVSSLFGF